MTAGRASQSKQYATKLSDSSTSIADAVAEVQEDATAAAASAAAAAASASAASTSASTASTAATNAGNSATAASTSASTASTAATNASNSASAASTSATNAATSETAAELAETNAEAAQAAAEAARDDVLAELAEPSLDLTDFQFAEIGSDGNLIWGAHDTLGPVGPFDPRAIFGPFRYGRDATTGLYALADENVYYMFPYLSQSWFPGQNTISEAAITTSPVDAGYVKMLSSGIWPNGDLNTGLVDAYTIPKSTAKQDVGAPFALALNTRLNAAIGRKIRIILSGAALSGQPYSGIKRGTATWAELLRVIREARDFARAEGKRLIIPGVLVTLGASDATNSPGSTAENQRRFLEQMRADLEYDINAIVPQLAPIRIFPWIPDPSRVSNQNHPEVALGYAQAMFSPFVKPVGCMYSLERDAADTLHLNATGYYKAGEMFADVVLDEIFGVAQGPLYVIDAWRSGAATFDVRFNQPITIDTSGTIVGTTSLTTTMGFDWAAANGAQGSTGSISSVAAVTGPNANVADTVRVTMTGTPATGLFSLFLACFPTGSGSGPTNGPRSLIRATASYATSGLGGALYHWAMPWKGDFQI